MRTEKSNAEEEIVRGYLLDNIKISALARDVDIFEQGYVNSLFAIELMTFLEKTFNIKVIIEDLDMANFKSLDAICRFLEKKKSGGAND